MLFVLWVCSWHRQWYLTQLKSLRRLQFDLCQDSRRAVLSRSFRPVPVAGIYRIVFVTYSFPISSFPLSTDSKVLSDWFPSSAQWMAPGLGRRSWADLKSYYRLLSQNNLTINCFCAGSVAIAALCSSSITVVMAKRGWVSSSFCPIASTFWHILC